MTRVSLDGTYKAMLGGKAVALITLDDKVGTVDRFDGELTTRQLERLEGEQTVRGESPLSMNHYFQGFTDIRGDGAAVLRLPYQRRHGGPGEDEPWCEGGRHPPHGAPGQRGAQQPGQGGAGGGAADTDSRGERSSRQV